MALSNWWMTPSKDMMENDEEIPEPLALKKYSGRFVGRTTPEMHRQRLRAAVDVAATTLPTNIECDKRYHITGAKSH